MFTLKTYVKWQFFGLTENRWSDEIVKEFILKSIELDEDVYNEIVDIEHGTLYQHLALLGQWRVLTESIEIQKAMIVNAKEQIKLIVVELQYEFDEEEEEKQKKHQANLILKTASISAKEDERLESNSFDNQRLMGDM